ncbi:hypothetical protein HZI31_06385 [Serratia fonticola]|uniref:transcriptional antitermination N peptide n=1 Tax=Serratia fonticola TaxID=47917 RepID=UPI0015C658E6|nr:hypothetical protein [Serratia fonticola]NYA42933.1 hypothetical protein [Serratia fonticola]
MNAAVRRHLRRKAAALSREAEKKIAPMLMGVSGNVAKALTMIDYKASPRPKQEACEGGASCLPQVALYAAGHRKTRKDAVHIIK